MRLFSGIQVIPVVYLTQCRGVMARTRSAVLCRNARASISSVLCVPSYRASGSRCGSAGSRSTESPSSVTTNGHVMPFIKDVFLGGSCGESNWRQSMAIPLLCKSGLTYINPQWPNWHKRYIPLELVAMDCSRVLLFVITSDTRSVAAMLLVSNNDTC